ncbi:MAG: hypothetical protein O3A10_00415 [Chloroflexi bacterium]|nr:hypothetical protein [Chloroflexota bacterium]MDA1145420.1 hypothetical protein [Chloroflexota bacterium]
MRIVTTALIALVALVAAACSSGAQPAATTEAGDTSPTASATPARSIADIVAASGQSGAATDTRPTTGATGGVAVAQRASQLKLDTPERQRLVQALEVIESLDAYEFEWSMTMPSIPDLPGGISFGGAGAIDPTNERFAMTIDFTEMLNAIASSEDASTEELAMIEAFFGDAPLQLRYVDGTTYMNWPIFGLLLGAETPWIAFTDPTGADAFGALPTSGAGGLTNPLDATAFLASVWGLEDVGRESVRGVDTTHYRGVIDVAEAMSTISPSDIAELEADLNGASISDVFGEFPVDVWIDDDNVVRRYTMAIDFSGFGQAGLTAEELIGSMVMTYEFFNIGGDISIVAPPASEVTAVSDSSFLDAFQIGS